jgi:hypothetical protein
VRCTCRTSFRWYLLLLLLLILAGPDMTIQGAFIATVGRFLDASHQGKPSIFLSGPGRVWGLFMATDTNPPIDECGRSGAVLETPGSDGCLTSTESSPDLPARSSSGRPLARKRNRMTGPAFDQSRQIVNAAQKKLGSVGSRTASFHGSTPAKRKLQGLMGSSQTPQPAGARETGCTGHGH